MQLKHRKLILSASTQTTSLNSETLATEKYIIDCSNMESKENTRKLPVLFKHCPESFSFISLMESHSEWASAVSKTDSVYSSTDQMFILTVFYTL